MKLRSTGSIQQEIRYCTEIHESYLKRYANKVQWLDKKIKRLEKQDVNQIKMQELMAEMNVDFKRDHQETMQKFELAVQEIKAVTTGINELKRQHQEATLEFNAAV